MRNLADGNTLGYRPAARQSAVYPDCRLSPFRTRLPRMSNPVAPAPAALVLAALNANTSSAAAKSVLGNASALTANLLSAASADARWPPPVAAAPVPAASPARVNPTMLLAPNPQFAFVQELLNAMSAELKGAQTDIRRRSDHAFYTALALGILAALSVIVGTGLALANVVNVGIVSSIAGVLSGVGSGVSYKLYAQENANLLATVDDLRRMENARFGLLAADRVADAASRDSLISDLVKRLNWKNPTKAS